MRILLATTALTAVILTSNFTVALAQRSAGVADVSPEERARANRQWEEQRRAEEARARAQTGRESAQRDGSKAEQCCENYYIEIDESAIRGR